MARANRDIMIFEKLHNRYGTRVATRVQQELSASEFCGVALEDLPGWLETRAESAHRDYQARMDNPLLDEADDKYIAALYRRWQEAADLAYLIAIAEDVSAQGHGVGK